MQARTALTSFFLPLVLALPTAAPGASAASLTELDASFSLSEGDTFPTYSDRIDSLSGKIDTVPIGDAFGEANRDGVTAGTGSCPSDLGVSGAEWFCWQGAENDPPGGDSATTDWYPQGISGDWDSAVAGGSPDGERLMVSWYDHTDNGKGTRISLIDNSDPNNVRYRHALLVEPTSGDDFDSMGTLHAGGIAWIGDYLYVVDTGKGIRVFDLTHVWRTEADSSKSKIGKVDGKYYAYDYRFAIPQIGFYSQEGKCKRPAESPETDPLCFSSVSVDHSTNPPSLLTGEFYYDEAPGARMARWSIDTSTGKLTTDGGTTTSANLYTTTHDSVQGSLSHEGTFWLTSSAGDHGELHTTAVGEEGSTKEIPRGPEDLSRNPDGGALWSLTEHPELRVVYRMPT